MGNTQNLMETKVLTGAGVLEHLCDECLYLGDRILIVFSDDKIKQSGLYARVVSLLNICGIDHVSFECETLQYSETEVNEAFEIGKKEDAKLILAIGDEGLLHFSKMIAQQYLNEFSAQHLPLIHVSTRLETTVTTKAVGVDYDLNIQNIKPATLFLDFDF